VKSASPSSSPRTTLASGRADPRTAEKKTELSIESSKPNPALLPPTVDFVPDSAVEIWRQTLSQFEDITSDYGSAFERVAIFAPNRLVVSFRAGYTLQKEGCERPERKSRIEQVLSRLAGRSMRVDFEVLDGAPTYETQRPAPSLRQRLREVEQHPLVSQAIELFGAETISVEEPPGKAK
jgi:hypothetical protein